MPPIGIPPQFCDQCDGPMICDRKYEDEPFDHWIDAGMIRLHTPSYKQETAECSVPVCPEYQKKYPLTVIRP